jgi:hypothetical protein
MEWVDKRSSPPSQSSHHETADRDGRDGDLSTHSNGPAPFDEHALADQLGIEIQGEG